MELNMTESNKTLLFMFQFYHHVNYLGECTTVNDSGMFGDRTALPEPLSQIASIVLGFVAFILNALSLFIFVYDQRSRNPRRADKTYEMGRDKLSRDAQQPSVQNLRKRRSKIGRDSSGSSVTASLMILCICECVFNMGLVIQRTIYMLERYIIPFGKIERSNIISSRHIIQLIPVTENFFFFIADVGLFTRNWTVCLITIARAEVVLWPMGAHRWQRLLRTRRWFLISFSGVLLMAIMMAYLKHADLYGLLCWDEESGSFGLWPKEFLMAEDQRAVFYTYGYFLFQTALVWCLIAIFTAAIVFGLKPWAKDETKLFSGRAKKGEEEGGTSSGRKLVPAQIDAIRRRQRSQKRATRVVGSIVVLFLLLEFMSFVVVCAVLNGALDPNGSAVNVLGTIANTLVAADSIINFLVFILTIKQFRLIAKHFLCYGFQKKKTAQGISRSNSNSSINNTMITTVSTDRRKIDLT
ncbi:unnamed protein product [Calicophoron daubneyi]|uniref:G-protein coupled receptors family 1 profile domain-containing protein n=1 Tax=Calicophoron daubneyi TaxID=300641 RepID=A0AAV2TFE3_CALDB